MHAIATQILRPDDEEWPRSLTPRLQSSAPKSLQLKGHTRILASPLTALFCSTRIPGDVILRAHDAARDLRDSGSTVIGGFHSPIEQECLQILLRGSQPIIVCPARAIEAMRIPRVCRRAFESGRILFLSPFITAPRRVSRDSSCRRNEIVAALANEAYVVHVEPGGITEAVVAKLTEWKVVIHGT